MIKIYKYATLIVFFVGLLSCEEQLKTGIVDAVFCETTAVNVTEADRFVTKKTKNPVAWQSKYTDTSITISFIEKAGNNGETETMNFEFTKNENCLKVKRAYKYYYGSTADVSAVTEMYLLEFYLNEWIVDEKFSGQIVYRDHHDKLIYTHNFWIELTQENYTVEDTNYTYFSECFNTKLPIDLDLNSDGKADYSIVSIEYADTGNIPRFTSYTIKMVSLDETINEILSPKNSSIPYPVIFEPPFTSENTKKYDANKFNSEDVKNTLDVFYEFASPYENFNYFLQNNLTYKKEFANKTDDYYLVRMTYDNNSYYGWIKIKFSATDCNIEILETYLNPVANQHISVD